MLESISRLFNLASPLLGREQPASTRLSRSLSWSGASAAQAARPPRRASTGDAPALTDSLLAAHGSDPVSSGRTEASGLRSHQQETIDFLQQVQAELRKTAPGLALAGFSATHSSHARHMQKHAAAYQKLAAREVFLPASRHLAATLQHGKPEKYLEKGGYLDTSLASTTGTLAQKSYKNSRDSIAGLLQIPQSEWNQKAGSDLLLRLRVNIKALGQHPEPAYAALREQAVILAESRLSPLEFVHQAAQLMQQIAQISQETLHWPMPTEGAAADATDKADVPASPDALPGTVANTAQTGTDMATAADAPDGAAAADNAPPAAGTGGTAPVVYHITNNYNNCNNTTTDNRSLLQVNNYGNQPGRADPASTGPVIAEWDPVSEAEELDLDLLLPPDEHAADSSLDLIDGGGDGRISPDDFDDGDSLAELANDNSQTQGDDALFDLDSLPPPDDALLRDDVDQETGTDPSPDDRLPGNDAWTETAPLSDQNGDPDDDMIEAEVMVDDAALAAKLQTESSAPALTVTRARNTWELPIAPQPLPANAEVDETPVDPQGDAHFVSTLNIPAPTADKVISQIETTLVAPPDPVQVTLVPAVGLVRQTRPVPLANGLDSTDAGIRPVAVVPPLFRTVASLDLQPVVRPSRPVAAPLTPFALDRSRLRSVKTTAEKTRKQPFSDLELAWDAIGVGKIDHEKGVYAPKALPPKPEFDLAVLHNPRNAEDKKVFSFGADRVNSLQFSTRSATQAKRTDEPESETRTEI